MQEGYLCSIVFLCVVFAPGTGVYQYKARNRADDPSAFQTLPPLDRAYALSRLNRKLLWAFPALGVVHVGLGISLIYDGTGRGPFCDLSLLRDCFDRDTLVVHMPNIRLDPFRVCLYDHNKTLGLAFEVSVLVFGTSLMSFEIRAALTA